MLKVFVLTKFWAGLCSYKNNSVLSIQVLCLCFHSKMFTINYKVTALGLNVCFSLSSSNSFSPQTKFLDVVKRTVIIFTTWREDRTATSMCALESKEGMSVGVRSCTLTHLVLIAISSGNNYTKDCLDILHIFFCERSTKLFFPPKSSPWRLFFIQISECTAISRILCS